MSNMDKYMDVFCNCFGVQKEVLNDQFVYQSVPAWDSVGHMGMIAALEESFDIMMETDDIVDFSSFQKGIEILGKYGIAL